MHSTVEDISIVVHKAKNIILGVLEGVVQDQLDECILLKKKK